MLDDPAMLLRSSGQEAGDVDEGNDRDLERIAEANEPRRLARGRDVEDARQHHRLVGHDAYGAAFHATEASDDIGGVRGLDLEEVAFVDHLPYELMHVIGNVG